MLSRWLSSPRNDRGWRVAVVVHAAAVIFLVGMIWTVHLLHYPLFAEVGPAEYVSFQAEHVRRIGALLLAPWVAEGVTTAALLLLARSRRERAIVLAISATAAGVLLISGLASAPAHADLADGFDPDVHGRLMDWNLLRALLWTASGVLSAALVWGLVAEGGKPPRSSAAPPAPPTPPEPRGQPDPTHPETHPQQVRPTSPGYTGQPSPQTTTPPQTAPTPQKPHSEATAQPNPAATHEQATTHAGEATNESRSLSTQTTSARSTPEDADEPTAPPPAASAPPEACPSSMTEPPTPHHQRSHRQQADSLPLNGEAHTPTTPTTPHDPDKNKEH